MSFHFKFISSSKTGITLKDMLSLLTLPVMLLSLPCKEAFPCALSHQLLKGQKR